MKSKNYDPVNLLPSTQKSTILYDMDIYYANTSLQSVRLRCVSTDHNNKSKVDLEQ